MVLIDGVDHALMFGVRGDNSGPASADEIIKDYAAIKKLFPNATVGWSRNECYANCIEKCFAGVSRGRAAHLWALTSSMNGSHWLKIGAASRVWPSSL